MVIDPSELYGPRRDCLPGRGRQDSPLAYINKRDAAKETAFLTLQDFLLSPETQNTLYDLGRLSGLVEIERSSKCATWQPRIESFW